MYKSVVVPVFGWLLSIEDDPNIRRSRFGHYRGRHREHIFYLRAFNLGFEFNGHGKHYNELVGMPKISLDWILDEFDASFDDLAVGSLRYHLDFSCCDNESRREQYEDLISRLSERAPRFTAAEMAILKPPGWTFKDDFEPLPDGGALMKPSPPEKQAVYEAYWAREDAYRERHQQARHDFIDVLPGLWS